MGLKIKLLSSFFDIVSELLKFNLSENWTSMTLHLGGGGGGVWGMKSSQNA